MNKELLLTLVAVFISAGLLFSADIGNEKKALVEFEKFQQDHGKSYSSEEKIYRFKIFADNLVKIEQHNSDQSQTYTLGITQFADMTTQEFIEKMLMKDLTNSMSPYIQRQIITGKTEKQSIDWRDAQGVLNPIKNQGQCGSCWAFSTTGALESKVAITSGTLNSFSQQQLVDCCGDKGYECLGCNGAWPEWAFNYINHEGIVLQNEYTYNARKGTCKETPTAKKFLNSAKPWSMLEKSDLSSLKQTISQTPVSICIDASNWSLYRSGVFSNCGKSILNHAVLAVGYQVDGVWIVRNSWGSNWGENGYIRLSPGNTCGIAQHAVIPNLA